MKNKKREESRRLQESKGGYQIAVHDFYVKGQKGMNSKKYLFLDYFILLNLLIIYCFFKLKMKTNFKDFLKINSNFVARQMFQLLNCELFSFQDIDTYCAVDRMTE